MDTSLASVDADQVDALRRFNRFYTQRLGILAPYLDSDLTLTEVRVLYELAHGTSAQGPGQHAAQIGALLGLDAGYLSRILRRFESRDWIARSRCRQDGRHYRLHLTEAGMLAFLPLQEKSIEQAVAALAPLSTAQRTQLVAGLSMVHGLLQPSTPAPIPAVALRELQPGDLGWVVEQHGTIYAREYGFDQAFEALVAQVVADYVGQHRSGRSQGWIAHQGDERLGCAFVVRKSQTVAQLRLLLVLPQARGMGLGERLTDACIAFARAMDYRKMLLWTNSCLAAARAIYAARGFVLHTSASYRGFGQDLVGETWELRL